VSREGAVVGSDPVGRLVGVGPRREQALAEEGVRTIEDLLGVLPVRHEDRRRFARVADLRPGDEAATLRLRVRSSRVIRTRRRGFSIFEAWMEDDSGAIRVLWFNQPYLRRAFRDGRTLAVFGRAEAERGSARLVLKSPEHEFLEDDEQDGLHVGRMVPVYRRLAGLSSRVQRGLLHRALESVDPDSVALRVPPEVARRRRLGSRFTALRDLHFPDGNAGDAGAGDRLARARRTLAFEEMFLLQVAVAVRRSRIDRVGRVRTYPDLDSLASRVEALVRFDLTAAQRRAITEIARDLASDRPMSRLLQGDVGCGKTVVAAAALLAAGTAGLQAAMMAPTEVLAEQHLRSLDPILGRAGAGLRVALLTGSTRAAQRRDVLEAVRQGNVDVLVGTHALFERAVEFRRLGLAVVDEQHRFGVLQRAALAGKGTGVDLLVMTATPIPRSLALTVYGDLDVSVIDELPPGRIPVETRIREEADRDRVMAGLRRALQEGRQAFVVVPRVEGNDRSDLKAAVDLSRRLAAELRPLPVGLLHGRMKGEDKDRVLREFDDGTVRILVATTVVEVGVDVSGASVIIVEHAERFGLSQLHQLRGRVGRGTRRSYCVLMVGDPAAGEEARARLEVLASTNDGFRIAERDLEMRGPGAVFGSEQHGIGDLKFLADALRDPDLLQGARDDARTLLQSDGHEAAVGEVLRALPPGWRRGLGLGSIG
jgi:ATP-dependent DNA helicase RecG